MAQGPTNARAAAACVPDTTRSPDAVPFKCNCWPSPSRSQVLSKAMSHYLVCVHLCEKQTICCPLSSRSELTSLRAPLPRRRSRDGYGFVTARVLDPSFRRSSHNLVGSGEPAAPGIISQAWGWPSRRRHGTRCPAVNSCHSTWSERGKLRLPSLDIGHGCRVCAVFGVGMHRARG